MAANQKKAYSSAAEASAAGKEKWHALGEHITGRKQPAMPSPKASLLTERYYNRDLSWLQFNERVLNEAADKTVPVLERLRFASIVSSNLDEFFMVRVASVMRDAERPKRANYPDGMDPRQLLSQIREQVLRQKSRQHHALRRILEGLAKTGVVVDTSFPADAAVDRAMRSRLAQAPFILNRSEEPPPRLAAQRTYVYVRFPREYAIVDVGDRNQRLIELPAKPGQRRFGLADRWVAARASALFPKRSVLEAFPFKVLRDAEIGLDPEEEESLEKQVIEGLHRRPKDAPVIRLEVDSQSYSEGALLLATQLGVDSAALYRFDLPLDLKALWSVYDVDGRERLRYPAVKPQTPSFLRKCDLFAVMRKGDVLLHHPYDSFDIVVEFLQQAARDPSVTSIFHTLYRTSAASPIIDSLKNAARMGKKVTAYVEIRARFDEEANMKWAEELREAGVRVVAPIGGYKVHSKITRVERDEDGSTRTYLHLGTGNYHPGTARQYTDLGLLTSDPVIGKEVSTYYRALKKREKPAKTKELLIAPGNLHERFTQLIKNETKIAKSGGRGQILAKMNSLVDPNIIEALYEASNAGVKIDLLVRGICCLRPGIPGLSENIRVTSVIDRFLEHSRIYYFRNGGGGNSLLYLSSADWMPRNFYTRYEIAFPVKDAQLRRFIRDVVLKTSLGDNAKSWRLGADGKYEKVEPKPEEERRRSQDSFQQLARQHYKGTTLENRFADWGRR
jgi:polyphosphate kinase